MRFATADAQLILSVKAWITGFPPPTGDIFRENSLECKSTLPLCGHAASIRYVLKLKTKTL